LTNTDKLQKLEAIRTHYPIAIVGEPGSGKSEAHLRLSDAEKAKTLLLNSDGKSVPDPSKYKKVITFDTQLTSKVSNNVLALSSKDPVAVQTLLLELGNFKDGVTVNRVVVDTITSLFDFVHKTAYNNETGWDRAAAYNANISEIFDNLKDWANMGKTTYVLAHYTPGDSPGIKQFIKVNGTQHKNNIEGYFTTVVKTVYGVGSDTYFFLSDTKDPLDSTKTKAPNGRFCIPRNSLIDLENYLLASGFKDRTKLVENTHTILTEERTNEQEEAIWEFPS